MLIFKNNIYEKKDIHRVKVYPSLSSYDRFEPRKLVNCSLDEDIDLIAFIKRQPEEFWDEEIRKFFPISYKTGGIKIIEKILLILREGLDSPSHWYHMNTYHFCVLYDILFKRFKTYNDDAHAERIRNFPDLKGQPIDFAWFTKYYFFNTVFLLDEDNFNSLSREEKKKLGYTCPCQFGVVNGLIPVPEEMALKESKDYPYAISV